MLHFEFWKGLYFRPRTFFKENISNVRPKYFKLAIALYFIGFGIDWIDNGLAMAPIENYPVLNTWRGFWIAVPIMGGIIGYLAFSLFSWFYHIRVKWSNGTTSINKSRYIYLYSSLIYYIYVIFHALFRTSMETKPFTPQEDFSNISEVLFGFLYFVAFLYSVHVSFRGVTTITDVAKDKARLWFYILPIVFYVVLIWII